MSDKKDFEQIETQEWLESLEYVLQTSGPERVQELLHELDMYAHEKGVDLPFTANTPYVNTIPKEKQPPFPGGREIERRIKSLIRWNAMAMVVRANREEPGSNVPASGPPMIKKMLSPDSGSTSGETRSRNSLAARPLPPM